jgi:hypothetical protein
MKTPLDRMLVRVVNMMNEGTTWYEASLWVTKKLPDSLKLFYRRKIYLRLPEM